MSIYLITLISKTNNSSKEDGVREIDTPLIIVSMTVDKFHDMAMEICVSNPNVPYKDINECSRYDDITLDIQKCILRIPSHWKG